MPHSKARILFALALTAVTAIASVLVALDAMPRSSQDDGSDEFQRLVGGLGLGPAVDLSRCAFSFDPRLCPDCPLQHGAAPGGAYFCPQHACSILCYPPLFPGPSHPR